MVEEDLLVWYADQVENEIQCERQLLVVQNGVMKVIEIMIEKGEIGVSQVSKVPDRPEFRVL
ncbi:MAG: hypothetical protein ACKPKO_26830, partial [Candidatus Fonsibacter sp.]